MPPAAAPSSSATLSPGSALQSGTMSTATIAVQYQDEPDCAAVHKATPTAWPLWTVLLASVCAVTALLTTPSPLGSIASAAWRLRGTAAVLHTATGAVCTALYAQLRLPVVAAIVALAAVAACAYFLATRPSPVFLVDFAVFEAPDSWRVTKERIVASHRNRVPLQFTHDSVDFVARVLAKSTLEDTTAFPPKLHSLAQPPPECTLEDAREEATLVICSTVAKVLAATGVRADTIDGVVVNCSLFCPTPSLSSIVRGMDELQASLFPGHEVRLTHLCAVCDGRS